MMKNANETFLYFKDRMASHQKITKILKGEKRKSKKKKKEKKPKIKRGGRKRKPERDGRESVALAPLRPDEDSRSITGQDC